MRHIGIILGLLLDKIGLDHKLLFVVLILHGMRRTRVTIILIYLSQMTKLLFSKVFTTKSSGTTTNSLEKYSLPSDASARYLKMTMHENIRNSITDVVIQGSGSNCAPTSTANHDDFENDGKYTKW
jgi:hypothetical protein